MLCIANSRSNNRRSTASWWRSAALRALQIRKNQGRLWSLAISRSFLIARASIMTSNAMGDTSKRHPSYCAGASRAYDQGAAA